MGRFSPGFPVIPALAAEPAPGSNGGISLYLTQLSVQNSTRLPRIKCGAGCDKRGNDGTLVKQMASVNTP